MPLTPATTDLFTKVGSPGTATTLSAPGYTSGVSTSLTVGSTTNWAADTRVFFAVDRAQIVDGVEERIPGTYCEFSGIVTGANTISNVVLQYGTPQNYPAGSLTRVYIPVSSSRENAIIDGLAQDHNLKGNHKTLTDDNGLEWLERGSVASAVNQVKVTNAITNTAPKIDASGDDTNINLEIGAKGTGVVKVQGAVPQKFFALYNFIESGCIWSGDAYGSTRAASMTSGFVWIGGKRLSVAAVTARSFTASKDTYADFADNGDGTAKIIYTEVTNNAASPTTLSDSSTFTDAANIRSGIIVTGASNIANAGSVNQGQEDKILPIASSIAYAVTDSNGFLICPRDPNRRIIGMRQITSDFATASASDVAVTGLSVPIQVPTGRRIRAYVAAAEMLFGSGSGAIATLWEGTVGSGTVIARNFLDLSAANDRGAIAISRTYTPNAASKTINLSLLSGSGTQTLSAGATYPLQVIVELV